MILKDTYTFAKQWPGVEFVKPEMIINPIIQFGDPLTMTIGVDLTFVIKNEQMTGNFKPDINPVPVNDLNYDPSKPEELIDRVLTRLNDFKV